MQIITTGDGSSTIFIPHLNEHYHSIHGAINESRHVFIKNGFGFLIEKKFAEIKVLEVGFGTGLNAFLTYVESKKNSSVKVAYTGIEAFPLESSLIDSLNFKNFEHFNQDYGLFERMHSETSFWASPSFSFNKLIDEFQNVNFSSIFNLIYFDAFAPSVQPGLWTEEIFSKIYNLLDSDGILVTYCAKGEFKRTLKRVGFKVETLPGPPGKREMVRAIK